MAKQVRRVVHETPVFVRVEYDDEYEGVIKVIVVDDIKEMRPRREVVSGLPIVLDQGFQQLEALEYARSKGIYDRILSCGPFRCCQSSTEMLVPSVWVPLSRTATRGAARMPGLTERRRT